LRREKGGNDTLMNEGRKKEEKRRRIIGFNVFVE
jgi:hypothetical protein